MSWTESHESAATGQRTIKFFDDEGTAAIKKVSVCFCMCTSDCVFLYSTCVCGRFVVSWCMCMCALVVARIHVCIVKAGL